MKPLRGWERKIEDDNVRAEKKTIVVVTHAMLRAAAAVLVSLCALQVRWQRTRRESARCTRAASGAADLYVCAGGRGQRARLPPGG